MDDQRADRERSDVIVTMDDYLAALRAHRRDWAPSPPDAAAKLEYHLFADAVFWSDEFPRPIPTELEDAFRMVINHRTSLLLGERGRFPEAWNIAQECYPDWPGFLPERCSANPEVADRIARIRRVSSWRIKRFKKWAFPTT